MDSTVSGVYLFDEFELDAPRRRLSRDGETVVLNQRAIELLIALVERGGEVVSKDELLEKVWKGQFVEENNLTVQIAALRKALGDKKGENRFLLTVPGKGYQFVGTLKAQETSAIVIENRTIERITVDEVDEPKPPRRKWPMIAGGIGVVLIAGIGIYLFATRYFEKSRSDARQRVASVIVLPMFRALDDNPEVALGLAEGVSYSIARLPELRVYSPNAYTKYKDAESVVDDVGRELNVEAVVICDFKRADDQVSVSASIVSTRDRSLLWGEQFRRPASEIASLKDDVSRAVGQVLRPASNSPSDSQKTNAVAYENALKGRAYWNRRSHESLKEAAAYYLKAIESDPQYGAAYAGLAETYVLFSSYDVASSKDSMPQAKAAALKALELDETLAEAHTALGFYYNYYEWDRVAAEREFRRAIELNPNYATAHQWLGSDCLTNLKRFDDALVSLKRAAELDPLSSVITKDTGSTLLFARRYDEALPYFRKIVALDPGFGVGHGNLALAYLAKGMIAESVAENRRALELTRDPIAFAYLALALSRAGESSEAKSLRDQLVEDSKKIYVPDYALAVANIALGDRQSALDHLEKEAEERGYWAGMYAVAPELDDLRSEPRFKALLKKMNLPE